MKPKNAKEAQALLKEIQRTADNLHYSLDDMNIDRKIYEESSSDAIKRIFEWADKLKNLDKE